MGGCNGGCHSAAKQQISTRLSFNAADLGTFPAGKLSLLINRQSKSDGVSLYAAGLIWLMEVEMNGVDLGAKRHRLVKKNGKCALWTGAADAEIFSHESAWAFWFWDFSVVRVLLGKLRLDD